MKPEETITSAEKTLRKLILCQFTKDAIEGELDDDPGDDDANIFDKLYPQSALKKDRRN